MRIAGYVLFTLGTLILVVGLLSHFAVHPDELADLHWVFDAVGAVPTVLSHMSDHPSTVLGLAAVVLTSIGLVLMKVQKRAHTRS